MARTTRYHHGDLKPALIAAASDILEAGGIAALSLRAVARRAGVSQTAPYRHFADKEALLAAVAAEGFRGLSASMAEAAEGIEEGPRRMRALGLGYVRFATSRPGHLRLMFGPEIPAKDAHPELLEAARAAFATLSGAAAANVPDGEGQDRAPVVAIAAWSLVHGLATLLVDRQIGPAMTGGLEGDELVLAVLDVFGGAVGAADLDRSHTGG